MTKTMVHLGFTLLLSILMIAAAEPASAAGTKVQVSFSGTSASGTRFRLYLEYDQSLQNTSPGLFVFTGSGLTHEICYVEGTGTCVLYQSTRCEPYKIMTSGSKIVPSQCNRAERDPNHDQVANDRQLSLNRLPLCQTTASPPGPVFVSSPGTGTSTFTITDSNGTRTYNIKSVSCLQPTAEPAPSPHAHQSPATSSTSAPRPCLARSMCASRDQRAACPGSFVGGLFAWLVAERPASIATAYRPTP